MLRLVKLRSEGNTNERMSAHKAVGLVPLAAYRIVLDEPVNMTLICFRDIFPYKSENIVIKLKKLSGREYVPLSELFITVISFLGKPMSSKVA